MFFDHDQMIDELALLVGAESPSHEPDALAEAADVLGGLMERRLGSAPDRLESAAGPHLLWRGGPTAKVLLVGHYDTVFARGTIHERPFRVADGHATGPGVFDMKAGIVQGLHAVGSLSDPSEVAILLTCDEEVGSSTSRHLVEALARDATAVLVLEPSADDGALKIERKGTGNFEVIVHGRAAHAGLEPEKGRNALVAAARLILEIEQFANPQLGTTVTPTLAAAGTADNVVPAEARVRIDVRISTLAEMDRIDRCFAGLRSADCELEIIGGINRPPMPASASAGLLELARRIDPGIGAVSVGGASDGNFTAAIGVPTLDGLGAVGGGAHADHEYVVVSTMPERARLLAGIIEAVIAG